MKSTAACERLDTDLTRAKARNVVNQETSTSSSFLDKYFKFCSHVVMRTISDEEAKKQTKLNWLKDGATRKKNVHCGENTGRWTKEEHGIFLLGLEKHGKEWKEISHMIPTRSVVQIRLTRKVLPKSCECSSERRKVGSYKETQSNCVHRFIHGLHRKRSSKRYFKGIETCI